MAYVAHELNKRTSRASRSYARYTCRLGEFHGEIADHSDTGVSGGSADSAPGSPRRFSRRSSAEFAEGSPTARARIERMPVAAVMAVVSSARANADARAAAAAVRAPSFASV